LEQAERALGHPIEIIAGREEARLVYLGVAHGLAAGDERRLVVDIGGGSTELIVGDGFVAKRMESITMGCVNMSRRFFADGKITPKAMQAAELAGALEMRPVKNAFRNAGWHLALGASGTIRAIRTVMESAGWTSEGEGITYDALKQLRDALLDAGHVDKLDLPGLNPERYPVFPGGVAVLRAVFRALSIQQMQVSDKALREGLIYEMLGRTHHEDVRESSVRALCRRYNVDMEHTGRVATTARALFAQSAGSWELHGGEYADILDWAARLHEIGLTVSHSQFHKHGAYLVANSDMPGFSRQVQLVLAALVRGHRRKFPLEEFEALPQDERLNAIRLCILLRIAVLLHRARSVITRVDVLLEVTDDALKLQFPEGWLEAHTLPRAELELEAKHLKATGFGLQFI
jgi:exopolyphosphatase/guanosine-5'-triphosphate,3'-diphosphate pyrophosphatase